MFSRIRVLAAILVVGCAVMTAQPVFACPMCKVANESDPKAAARPRAYMYSILFMLGMPVTLFTGFGVSFYRLSKQQQAADEDMDLPGDDTAAT